MEEIIKKDLIQNIYMQEEDNYNALESEEKIGKNILSVKEQNILWHSSSLMTYSLYTIRMMLCI